jgi:prepilin-type N-terminal cleavage/methylation domain-containing protein
MPSNTPNRLSSSRRGGFTLIELMIVVILLGVLAAILIGYLRNASSDAKRVGAEEAVRLATQGIELYKADTGQLPNLIGPNWAPLTEQTTVMGRLVGPYLKAEPKNLLASGNPSCITDGTGTIYTNVCSFLYDYNSGAGSGRFVAAFDPEP